MDNYKVSGSNYMDQAANAHTRLIVDRFKGDYDFRNHVIEIAKEEFKKSGFTGALIDASTVANMILYNPNIQKELGFSINHKEKTFKYFG